MNTDTFKQYELAWSEFLEWFEVKYHFKLLEKDLPYILDVCMLAILQQYLDEKGIRAYYNPYHQDSLYRSYVMVKDFETEVRGLVWGSRVASDRVETATEALYAACIKGFEIRNKQLKEI
jgi:hypothetical protein